MVSTDRRPGRIALRPWFRRLAIYVLPLLAVLFAVTVWDYIETRRLMREIEAIQAKGEPITIAPLVNRAQDGAENAEYRYSAAALLSLPHEEGRDPTLRGRSAMATASQFHPIRQWLTNGGERPSSADVARATTALIEQWEDALALADKGAGQPYQGVSPYREFDARTSGLLNLSRLVSARTIGLSFVGNADAAVESAISGIRLTRAIRPSQRWLEWTAHETPVLLSLAKPDEQALARLQAAIASEEDPDGLLQDFVNARARFLNDVWLRFYRVTPGMPLPAAFPTELLPSPQMRPLVTHQLVRALRVWSQLLQIARKPWSERRRLAVAPIAQYANEKFHRAGTNGVLSAVTLFHQAIRPDLLVYDRTSRIAVAVERYRRSHADGLPATLEALVPQYLESIPEDPLTGQPLRYRATADAYTVYSVGPDGDDDGGALLRPTPPTADMRFDQKADMGIRVALTR
jgi:hypothetical protein